MSQLGMKPPQFKMGRLEMKPPPFDSYEIEEPSDEEQSCSR